MLLIVRLGRARDAHVASLTVASGSGTEIETFKFAAGKEPLRFCFSEATVGLPPLSAVGQFETAESLAWASLARPLRTVAAQDLEITQSDFFRRTTVTFLLMGSPETFPMARS